MPKASRCRCAVAFCACLALWPALACRYNVRDAGFADLESEAYTLYCFTAPDTPSIIISNLQQAAESVFRESNVRLELVGRQTQHPALSQLARWGLRELPAAVLRSPDGQTTPLELPAPQGPSAPEYRQVLTDLVSSPARERIVRQVAETFGVVLLIEGLEAAENVRARDEAGKAISQVRAQMNSLPKPIAQPPSLVTISQAERVRERMLLWSLGLGPDEPRQARVAVLYGRARWMGPLMKGDEISTANIAALLAIVGADCECNLDLSWTRGTRLPVRWTAELHTQLVKALGFDPDNPEVKAEISRILNRTPIAPANKSDRKEKQGQLAGRLAPEAKPARSELAAKPERANAARRAESGVKADRRPWLFLGGVGIAVLLSGGLLLLRSSSRAKR
jgi:hypothetical protein